MVIFTSWDPFLHTSSPKTQTNLSLLGGGYLSSTKLDSSGIYHVGKYANLTQRLGYEGMKLYMGYNVDS